MTATFTTSVCSRCGGDSRHFEVRGFFVNEPLCPGCDKFAYGLIELHRDTMTLRETIVALNYARQWRRTEKTISFSEVQADSLTSDPS